MEKKLFVQLPVQDLDKSKAFFADLGLNVYGSTDDVAAMIISEHTQVMLLTHAAFATYSGKEIIDADKNVQMMLAVGVENPAQVDEFVEKAFAAGATPAGPTRNIDGRYQRSFNDLDGHHWETLCLVEPGN